MSTLTFGDVTYEVVDEKARQDVDKFCEKLNSLETISSEIKTEAYNLVSKSLSRGNGNVLRFIAYSDAHQQNGHELITKGNKELGQAMGEIVNLIGVDFVSGIGDYSWAAYTNTTEEVKAQLLQFNKFVKHYIKGIQELNCEGNHDDANYSTVDNDGDGISASTEKLSLAETYSLIYANNKNVVYDTEHYLDGYCYKDFKHLKVRVICLNTEQGTGDGGLLEGYQLKWFAETALNMSGKTDWNVITLAHHPLDYPTITLFRDSVNIIDAFISGLSLSTTTNDGTVINIDYSDRNCQYVGHFHGHAHAYSICRLRKYTNASADSDYTELDAYQICIPNACYGRTNQYVNNTNARFSRYSTETSYNKSDKDGQRTSFNLITVDLDKMIIYADNYGAGIDRVISYYFPSYTNQLPISIDTDRSIYNGIGYKEDLYLSAGNIGTRTGSKVTGFIPVPTPTSYDTGQVIIRFLGGKLDNTTNTRIGYYYEDFTTIGGHAGSQFVTEDTDSNIDVITTLDEEGYIVEMDISQILWYYARPENIVEDTPKYIRLSSYGIDSETIITVNEEIK